MRRDILWNQWVSRAESVRYFDEAIRSRRKTGPPSAWFAAVLEGQFVVSQESPRLQAGEIVAYARDLSAASEGRATKARSKFLFHWPPICS
jgi:hypothetical protein